MKKRKVKDSVWTAKNDQLLKDYYAIYKKPSELKKRFLKEFNELMGKKKQVLKQLKKVCDDDQARNYRAKALGLIK